MGPLSQMESPTIAPICEFIADRFRWMIRENSKDVQKTGSMTNRGCFFLSDLHLLSKRSTATRFNSSIHHAAQNAHTIILGGDIFDFKWSVHRSLTKSIVEAIRWLEKLVLEHSDTSFYYLLGNHDSHPDFVMALDRLAFEQPRLQWQPHILRLGSCVFLHGDVLDGGLDHDVLDTHRRMHDDKPPPLAYRHWLYDAVVQTRMHVMVTAMAKPHTWVLRKLSRYLDDQGMHIDQGVSDVYFGHTHRMMSSISYDGLRFHNGGAAIQGINFRIVEAKVEDPLLH
jgi:UDP-2,3-diacylglucosamine hydrolase